jgi:hypothetical protein
MSEWISSVSFTRTDFDGAKPPTADTPTNGVGQIPPVTTPGSGTTPPIVLTTDYWLRDEDNKVITNQNNEGISLEGLEFKNA